MLLTDGLKAQVGEKAEEVILFDLNSHITELNGSNVIDRMKLFFAWGNYFHWCSGMGVRGQANQIEGWLVDNIWGYDSDDWFELKAFILDTSEYLNDEDSFFDLKAVNINAATTFNRRIFMGSYLRFGTYIRRALAELNPEDAYVIELVNTLAQFWVEWYAENAKDIQGYDMVLIAQVYDAIQGNLREVSFGRTEAALDDNYTIED